MKKFLLLVLLWAACSAVIAAETAVPPKIPTPGTEQQCQQPGALKYSTDKVAQSACGCKKGICGCRAGKIVCCEGTVSQSCTCNQDEPLAVY